MSDRAPAEPPADRDGRLTGATYRQLAEHAVAGLYIIQANRFVYVNPQLAEILGYSREELLAMESILQTALEEDRPMVEALLRRRATGELTRVHYRLRIRRKSGEVRRIEILGGQADLEGRPALIGTVLDVTERCAAEEALRESEERFRRVFEEGPLGMALVGPDFRLIQVNDALCAMLGYARDELTGKTLTEITHPADVAADVVLATQLFAGAISSYRQERRYVRKNGQILYGALTASIIRDTDGRVLYGLSMVDDVTRQRQMEAQLFQSQRLESLGQLAGGVAHNYNNALTAIFGYSELALRYLDPEHPARAEIERIQLVGEQSAQLTRQLLTFSRRDAAEPSAFDLNDAVLAAEALLRPLIGSHIDLVFCLAPKAGTIRADRSQIEQVVANLVLNARDAMPDGGRLTVETDAVELAAAAAGHPEARPGPYARLRVSDTGVGMDVDTLGRIFEPFFTTKQLGHGVGLGLAMVHGAATQSGGFVDVESEPGQGTMFSVYLPRTC